MASVGCGGNSPSAEVGCMATSRSFRRYKALSRALFVFTDFRRGRRISFITLTAPPLRREYSMFRRRADVESVEYFSRLFPRVLRAFLLEMYERFGVSGFYVLEKHKDGRLHAHVVFANAPWIEKMQLVEMWRKAWERFGWRIPSPSVDIQAAVYWKKGRFVVKGRESERGLYSVLGYITKYVSKSGARIVGFGEFKSLRKIYVMFSMNALGGLFERRMWLFTGDRALLRVRFREPDLKVLSFVRQNIAHLWETLQDLRKGVVRAEGLEEQLIRLWLKKIRGEHVPSLSYFSPLGYIFLSYARSPLLAMLFAGKSLGWISEVLKKSVALWKERYGGWERLLLYLTDYKKRRNEIVAEFEVQREFKEL